MTAQSAQPLYIGGRPVDATSGETFTVTNPYDGSLLATIGQASQADVDSAVQAAQRGQREWAAMTG
ncbi:MAG TPA: betaine-aldehyde dehydrogenase, partial [Halomonas sp.]|nr:betaine-aldehyde dehydrogenase [Halomonas sp.]